MIEINSILSKIRCHDDCTGKNIPIKLAFYQVICFFLSLSFLPFFTFKDSTYKKKPN